MSRQRVGTAELGYMEWQWGPGPRERLLSEGRRTGSEAGERGTAGAGWADAMMSISSLGPAEQG